MSDVGLATAAETVGVDRSTLRRWRWRRWRGLPLAGRRGPRPLPISFEVESQAAALVREIAFIGVEAMRRSCPGLTRRGAARIKAATRQAMERERRALAAHVDVTVPGVIRGFDSMHIRGAGHLLVAADGAVPYRTSWALVPRYDGRSVAQTLADDFVHNGAPLVMRFDRARQHSVAAVQAVLTTHGVLAVHGRARYPQYYGQLERQNRDHRAWLRQATGSGSEAIERMMSSLNNSWRRRRLGWSTPAERWEARPELNMDRAQLRRDVEQRWRHLSAEGGLKSDLGWRLAVQQALTSRGLIRVVPGGGC